MPQAMDPLRKTLRLLMLSLLLLGTSACADASSPEERFERLSVAVAALDGEVVQLEDRRGQSSDGAATLLLDDLHLVGDLHGDGSRVAAGTLFITRTGQPTLAELVVAEEEEHGGMVHRASHPLGEGLRIEGIRFVDGEVMVYLLTPTPEDPPCCPSRSELRRFTLVEGRLLEQMATAR